MSDPFAHGTPAGDYHTWVKPQRPPCPHCPCCTEALCRLAVEKSSACHWEALSSDYDLVKCPCWQRNSTARAAFTEAAPAPVADGQVGT